MIFDTEVHSGFVVNTETLPMPSLGEEVIKWIKLKLGSVSKKKTPGKKKSLTHTNAQNFN
jgi:hypothetical protein